MNNSVKGVGQAAVPVLGTPLHPCPRLPTEGLNADSNAIPCYAQNHTHKKKIHFSCQWDHLTDKGPNSKIGKKILWQQPKHQKGQRREENHQTSVSCVCLFVFFQLFWQNMGQGHASHLVNPGMKSELWPS